MNEPNESRLPFRNETKASAEFVTPVSNVRKLADVVREVKNHSADRDDVVVEMREAQRGRLEILAAQLEPVFSDVPRDDGYFDFAISSGLQPRLWIDATSHVAMGRDRRVYRFVRDTRIGRVVLAESAKSSVIAESVTRYIAERMVERQRLLDGEIDTSFAGSNSSQPLMLLRLRYGAFTGLLADIGLFLAGALVGGGFLLALLWGRL